MNFENEAELQDFIHSVVGGEREVKFPDKSRIDILTGAYAIEVKPKLTRSAILQALGQLEIYKPHCPNHQPVIAGVTPNDTDSAYATAERARKRGVEVWFVDQMPQFQQAYNGVASEHTAPSLLGSVFDWLCQYWYWILLAVLVVWWPNGDKSNAVVSSPYGSAQIMESPSIEAQLISSRDNGGKLVVVEVQGNWAQVMSGNVQGWVRRDELVIRESK